MDMIEPTTRSRQEDESEQQQEQQQQHHDNNIIMTEHSRLLNHDRKQNIITYSSSKHQKKNNKHNIVTKEQYYDDKTDESISSDTDGDEKYDDSNDKVQELSYFYQCRRKGTIMSQTSDDDYCHTQLDNNTICSHGSDSSSLSITVLDYTTSNLNDYYNHHHVKQQHQQQQQVDSHSTASTPRRKNYYTPLRQSLKSQATSSTLGNDSTTRFSIPFSFFTKYQNMNNIGINNYNHHYNNMNMNNHQHQHQHPQVHNRHDDKHPFTTMMKMKYTIVGLFIILFIVSSSSWWQIHIKHLQTLSTQTGTTENSNGTPNPYYFWNLLYNNKSDDATNTDENNNSIHQNEVSSRNNNNLKQLEDGVISQSFTSWDGITSSLLSTTTSTSSTVSSTSSSNTYTPPTITSARSSKFTSSSIGSKLVIAGKMTVLDGFCNIAELSLNSGEWSLKERIQLSLYNSYSGGEVYSLLVNHTFNRDSFSFFDNGGNFVSGNSLGNEDKPKSSYPSGLSKGEVHGGELIVVGAFDTTDRNSQTTYCSVGAWDGTELSKVGEGLCNSALSKGMKITSAAMAGPDDVYVAGSFSTQVWNGLRHEFVHIYNIAHYNAVDKVWLPLPVGQISCSWCQVTVLALAYDSKRRQLHVSGKFNAIDGHNIPSSLAIYDLDSGHLVAHPGGGLTMYNETQDGVGTALQLDEEAGVLYVMGTFERLGTGQLCLGLAAYEISSSKWTCLADAAHTVMPSGGGNMLLTPYGLMVAGRTTSSTSWPDSSRPYTIALLNTTRVGNSGESLSSLKTTHTSSTPRHEFTWSWLPGFDGHNEPLHSLANGFGDFEGTVFIAGDNLVAAWYYEEKTDVTKNANGITETRTTLVPVTENLSKDNVQGAVMAIAQLKPEDTSSGNDRKVVGTTIAVYFIALGALLGMLLALVCNRSINQTLMALFYSKEQQMNGISLDTLTYSAIKNTNVNDVYQRAMKVRCVPNPHFLQLIDPQDIILHRIIGEGTFGRVWSARLNSSSVAVKEFVFAQAAVAGKSAHQNEIIEEIIGEAGMMAILRHPNVLQLFGCSLTAQAIWIVCELCSLGSLRQLLDDKERELTMEFRLKIALQVAEGMMYLHNQDPPIIHRDLKSHNIMVHETFTETTDNKSDDERTLEQRMSENAKNAILPYRFDQSGRAKKMSSEATVVAKIGDWGSARATLSGSRTMTHGVGTACWLAPEVILHARSSKFSDVYSYGIILWELATREEVYAGLESTQIIASVANDNLRPDVPENNPLGPLMVKCWCEKPEDRLTFKDIVKELNQLITEL